MSSHTTLTLVGNLTADPELRFTSTGTALATFAIASTPRTLDRESGEWRDGDTLFLRCTVWRDLADHVAESLHKGQRVIATGRLRQSSWEDPATGDKRTGYDLDVDDIGPSLRWAVARVSRIARDTPPRNRPDAPPADDVAPAVPTAGDPWMPGPPAPVGARDEPPF